MFLLKLTLSYMNDNEIPVNLSRGVLYSHYEDGSSAIDLTSQEVLEKPYYDSRYWAADFLTFTGAFCAKKDGEYKFTMHGKGGFWFNGALFNEANGKKVCGGLCSSIGYGHDCDALSITLRNGTCYPFSFEVCTGTGWIEHPYQIKTSYGDSSNFTVWDDYVQNTDKYHCMKEFYGTSCTPCTAKCGPYGFCGGNERDAGSLDRCTCTNSSVANDPFCRDMTARPETGRTAGLELSVIENHGNGDTLSESVIQTVSAETDEPYARLRLAGFLYAPQDSTYAVRLKGSPNTRIVLGNKDSGEIKPSFRCEPESTPEVQTSVTVTAVAGELIPLLIEADGGCAMEGATITAQWCFYRYYTDRDIAVDLQNESFWEDIPSIYLFH